MAAGVLYSTQLALTRSVPPVMKDPSDGYGKVRRLVFTHTVGASDAVDVGTTVALVYIPAGCRLWGGVFAVDAGYSEANGTAAIGNGTTANKYLAAGAIAGVGEYEFGNTILLGFGQKVTTGFYLTMTTAVAVLIAAGEAIGYVDITVE